MAEIVRQTQDLLARYLSRFPGEAGSLLLLQQQLGSDAALFTRSNMKGHVTSSAAVLTPDGSRILLIHRKRGLKALWRDDTSMSRIA